MRRPCACVCGAFASEVARVEFGNRSVEVVGFEHNDCRHSFVCVDLRDMKNLGFEGVRLIITFREARPCEDELLTSGRKYDRCDACEPDIGSCLKVFQLCVATASDTCVYRRSAVVDEKAFTHPFLDRSPVACCEGLPVALRYAGRRVLQLPGRLAQLIESCNRGIEVGFVEDFAAADHVTVKHHEVDRSPLGVEALPRGEGRCVGDDCAAFSQPMYRLDMGSDFFVELPAGA